VQVVDQTALPAPSEVDGAIGSSGYRIGAFDRLIVDVFGFEELKAREVQVDAAGPQHRRPATPPKRPTG
jgi:polysaccharide export outer membrane protein